MRPSRARSRPSTRAAANPAAPMTVDADDIRRVDRALERPEATGRAGGEQGGRDRGDDDRPRFAESSPDPARADRLAEGEPFPRIVEKAWANQVATALTMTMAPAAIASVPPTVSKADMAMRVAMVP